MVLIRVRLGKTVRVRFQLTGMTVSALDPIPPAGTRA
jgi:hypothetical protein